MSKLNEKKSSDRRSGPVFRCPLLALALVAFLALGLSALAASRSWRDAVSGSWSDTNRWDPVGLPAIGDDVYITNSGVFTVTLSSNPQYKSLLLGGEDGTQSIDWVTGNMPSGGAVLVATNGVMNIVSNTGNWYLSGTVTNYGAIVWRSGSAASWYWTLGARLENAPGGLLDVQQDGTITMSSGAGTFRNLGTWRKSGGSGTLTLGNGIGFTHAGLVDAQQGAIVFGAGFTSSGTFSVASNAAVRLTGGTFHLLPGHQFAGDGYYGVPSASVTIDGPITESNFRMDGVTLTMSNTLSGTLQWTAGTLAGAWSIASNGVLNIISNTGSWALSGVLTNYGQIVWRSGSAASWYWALGARLENAPGGLLDVQQNGTITMSSGVGTFNNLGTWRKSGGSGTLTLGNSIGFTHAGVVDVQQGAIVFGNGFTSSGTFSVASNAAVRLTGGTVHLLPGHAFSGNGYYGVSSGSVTVDGPITEPNFRMDGVTLTMSNSLSGTLQWTAGTLGGAWSIATNGVVNIVSNTGNWYLSGVVTNYGRMVWRSGSASLVQWLSGARLENAPGGLLDVQLDGTMTMSSGVGTFNNLGTWRKSGGSGTLTLGSGIGFTNAGVVDVQQGAVAFGAGFTSSGTFSVASNAAVRLTGGTVHLLSGHAFSGSGYYGVYSGSVTVDGPITESNFRMDGGTLTQNSPLSGTLQWSSGTLAGSWSIATNGLVNLVTNGANWTLSGVVTNFGTIVWRPGVGGVWYWSLGTHLENQTSGLLDMQMDGTIFMNSGAGVLNNLGTWRKTGGTGITSLGTGVAFTNAGAVEVQQGALVFGYGFTSSGSFSVASNTAIRLTGGTFHLLPGHQFTGSGYYGVPSGAVTLDGPITESNFRMDGGTLTQNSPLSGTLQWVSGTLAGSWSIATNGLLNLATNGGSWTLSGVVTNYGAIVWRPGVGGVWYWSLGTHLENQTSGLLDMQMDGIVFMNSGAGVLNNLGTWRKTGGTGITSLGTGVAFTNAGAVEVQQGALVFGYGFTSSGSFSVASNAATRLTGGTFHLLPGHQFTGSGYYGVPSGAVTLDGPITESNFRMDGGTLTQNSPLSGTLQWVSGTLAGSWSIATNGLLNLVTNGASWTLSGVVTNYGAIVWRPGVAGLWYWALGTHLENQPSGLVDIQMDGTIFMNSGAGVCNNLGTWRKSGGAGTASFGAGVWVTNSGVLASQKGTLTLPATYAPDGGLLSIGIRATNDYGRIAFTGSAPLTGRVETVVQAGFRPPLGATFNALTYLSYTGMVEGFNGVDLDNGLRLDPRISPTRLSFVATAYDTNEVKKVGISRLAQHVFLWWPIAVTNGVLEAATEIMTPSWETILATNNNAVLPTDVSNRFFCIGGPL